ncbi:MAG: hypothetical protein M9962_02960 [Oligoflexia bacterium]|nr:hypothetical protein [Oligoflexia bacterium]
MRIVLLSTFLSLIPNQPAKACRNSIVYDYPSSQQAHAKADLILYGKFINVDKDSKNAFSYKYRMKIEKAIKGKIEKKDIFEFTVDHHSCAKYKNKFSTNDFILVYLIRKNTFWDLIRIIPEDIQETNSIEEELRFLRKFDLK